MNDNYLFKLCGDQKWDQVRAFLDSDSNNKDEKRQFVFYQGASPRWTCLHRACYQKAPDDIVKSLIDIGGKDLVMMTSQSGRKMTALHYACYGGAYFNVIKMLIDIGGEELVVVKDSFGDTALHTLSRFIHDCDNAADKINLLIEVAGTEIILTEKNKYGKTPLDLATAKGTSDEIKALFQPRTIKNEPEISSNDASNFVPDDLDNDTVITELQQDQLQAAKQKIADLETQKTEHRKTIADLETEIVLLHEQNMKHDKEIHIGRTVSITSQNYAPTER